MASHLWLLFAGYLEAISSAKGEGSWRFEKNGKTETAAVRTKEGAFQRDLEGAKRSS